MENLAPEGWFAYFARHWNDSNWTERFGQFSGGYMRARDDQGWRARMWTFQALVAAGQKSVPVLLDRLSNGSSPERILAAQTAGYLLEHMPFDPLHDALRKEPDPAIRLYLVDSIRMLGYSARVDWDAIAKTESNRDVRRHISYAQQQGAASLDKSVIDTLVHWAPSSIDTAVVGQPAPDFELPTITDQKVRLSNYRGRKHVIVVFLYGDT